MNTITVQLSRNPLNYLRFIYTLQKVVHNYNVDNVLISSRYGTTVDVIDAFTMDLLQRHRNKVMNNPFKVSNFSIRNLMDSENITPRDVPSMTTEELDYLLLQLISKNKDKQVMELITDCSNIQKLVSDDTLKKLFRHYSFSGKPHVVEVLLKYSSKVGPYLFKRNGHFMHYLAKAQCMKGNSEKGLSILTSCYKEHENLRSFYRTIFRELIQDSVLNRSEASLVIFKKYVLEFSTTWDDHYPMVCLWHICWSSTWFSDQMLSNELLEASTVLQDIVRDKSAAFSINILRTEYNEDAVVRLLQTLLKYEMMTEYVKILQVLFSYKLRNRDLRGCTEIIRNCETLGVTLSPDQQGKYIKMLIDCNDTDKKQPSAKTISKNFKLKF